MCATTALNWTISGEELGHYKLYWSLIFSRKCVNEDVRPQGGGLWCPTSPKEMKVKVHICKTLTQHYRGLFFRM